VDDRMIVYLSPIYIPAFLNLERTILVRGCPILRTGTRDNEANRCKLVTTRAEFFSFVDLVTNEAGGRAVRSLVACSGSIRT